MRHFSKARTLLALTSATLTAAAMALAFAAPANAEPKRLIEFFGNPTGANSSLTGEFSNVQGVAVNSNPSSPWFGDIYVVDQNNQRIQRFSSLGAFELTWGKDVIKANPEIAGSDLGNVFERCTFAPDCKAGVSGSLGGELSTPRGVAIDQQTGDIYVVERNTAGGARAQAFTGDGEFIWAAGKDAIANGSPSDPASITTAQVCTVAEHCQSTPVGTLGGEFGRGGISTGSTGAGNGIAVSPVINPVTGAGNVVITDRGNRRVQEFTSTGGFVRAFGWDTVMNASPSDPVGETGFQVCSVAADCKEGVAGSGVGQFGGSSDLDNGPNRVAVDSTGAIYTVENGVNFRLQKFTPQVGLSLSVAVINPDIGGGGPALALSGTGSSNTPFDVTIGPSDHVLVLKAYPAGAGTPVAEVAERRVVELDAGGALVEIHIGRGGLPSGVDLAVNTVSDEIYLTATSPPVGGGQGVYVAGEFVAPSVAMGVGSVGPRRAELFGLVDPNGPDTPIGFRTSYHFESRRVGDPVWMAASADRDAGNGFEALPVAETLEDLDADTDYEAKLVASKPFSGLPPNETVPVVFSTPPSQPDIDAVYVTERDAFSARLNALINPNGEATSYRFEYGPTASYGTSVPASVDGSAGAGTSSVVVSEAISGLAPGMTYHYRVTATSVNGTTRSADQTFTTRRVAEPPDGRVYELVSPADKVGGSGVGPWYTGVGAHGNSGIPAYEGERFASLSYYGASLANGAFSYGTDWTLGQRADAGWVNKPAFTRPGGQGSPEFAKLAMMDAASDDLSLTAWGGGGSQLAIFPEQQQAFGGALGTTGGSALREWDSGRWEIIAPWAAGQQTAGGSFNMAAQVAPDGGFALAFGGLRGVAGAGDPTADPCSLSCERNVYIDDVTAGLSDTFPGNGLRSLVNVCTGEGPSRTQIPTVNGDGRIAGAPCPGSGTRPVSGRDASLASDGLLRGHISDDGSRVFFMSPNHLAAANNGPCEGVGPDETECPPQVYVWQRNLDRSATVRWISESTVAGQDASLMAAAVFEGATPDGDKAFFRTASPLTADDPNGGSQVPGGVRSGTASSASVDLYMYDFPDARGADPGDGTLTRISAGPTGASDANVSTNTVASATSGLRALGDDGSLVYFTTAAPLAGVAAAGNGTVTAAGGTQTQTATKNLYIYNGGAPADRRWRFVARLPAASTFGGCAASGSLTGTEALQSGGNGTGRNGGIQINGGGSHCVRPTTDGAFVTFFTDGRLTADDPDGVSGDVYAYDAATHELARVSAPQRGAAGAGYVCVSDPSSGAATGAACHGDLRVSAQGSKTRRALSVVTDPAVPGDRIAFFESASQLVPEDRNDVYDVYRWRNGELALVSTGLAGAEPALYQGNDRTGTNVFMSTRDRLSWQDHDAVLDVYTARVEGGIPEPPDPSVCSLLAGDCRGGGALPVAMPAPQTTSPSAIGGGAVGERRSLSVGRVSRRARRVAARSGVLKIVVRSSEAGRVTAVARARLGKRGVRRVARGSVVLERAGRATLRLKLSRPARKRLRRGKVLSVRVGVTAPGASGRSMTVRLVGVKS